MSELVLVTGATGKTGRSLAAQLRQAGVAFRAATRNGERPFDWTQSGTWEGALEDVTSVYLVAPPTLDDPYSRMVEFLERAVLHGVRRFVLLSVSSLPSGGPAHGQVHQWLQDHTADWAVLRPSAFMQNFSEGPYLATIRKEDTFYSNTGTGRVGFIDAGDIARAALGALTAPTARNTDFVLTGEEALSYDQAAEIISAACGRKITHTHISTDELTDRFVGRGLPKSTAQLLAAAYRTIADGAADFTTPVLQDLTGQSSTTFREFADANTQVWRRA
jgi:uncharacterized protein YbjT (DUF2867 family)